MVLNGILNHFSQRYWKGALERMEVDIIRDPTLQNIVDSIILRPQEIGQPTQLCEFLSFEPCMNISNCMDWSVLENSISRKKQCLHHWVHLVIQNAHIVPRSNQDLQDNDRACRKQRNCCPSHDKEPPRLEEGSSSDMLIRTFSRCTHILLQRTMWMN